MMYRARGEWVRARACRSAGGAGRGSRAISGSAGDGCRRRCTFARLFGQIGAVAESIGQKQAIASSDETDEAAGPDLLLQASQPSQSSQATALFSTRCQGALPNTQN